MRRSPTSSIRHPLHSPLRLAFCTLFLLFFTPEILPTFAQPILGQSPIISSGVAQAQMGNKGYAIEVNALGQTLFQSKPSQIISTNLELQNHSKKDQMVREFLNLPEGWNHITQGGPFLLSKDDKSYRLLGFSIPSHAPAGRYSITYLVRSTQDYALQDQLEIIVDVLEERGVQIMIERAPSIVLAGDEAQAILRLFNHGNAPANIDLAVERSRGLSTTLSEKNIHLGIREAQDIVVRVQTQEGSTRAERHNIIIKASDQKGQVDTRTVLHIETVPRASTKPELFHTLPSQLSVRTVVEGQGIEPQVEWKGRGYWGDDKSTKVDFLIRGPDTQETGLFSQREAYYLSVEHHNTTLRLGDQSYKLTRLTEQARYGRGAELATDHKYGGARAFYVESLWNAQSPPQFGAQFYLTPVESWKFSFNALLRESENPLEAGVYNTRIYSGLAQWAMNDKNDLTLEMAGNQDADGQLQMAYRGEAQGRIGSAFNYHFSAVHAAPHYQGYFRDINQIRLNSNLALSEKLQLRGFYQSTERNLANDPEKGGSDHLENGEIELRCAAQNQWCPGVGYRYMQSEDRLDATQGSTTHMASFRLNKSGERLKLNLRGEWGQQYDNLNHSAAIVHRYEAFGELRMRESCALSASGRWNYHSEEETYQRPSGALGFRWQPSDRIRASANYRFGGISLTTHQADGQVQFQVGQKNTVSLMARYNQQPQVERTDYAAMLQISRQIGIPTTRKSKAGAVSGRIYDVTTGEGLEGVVVQVGGAAGLTNAQGRYTLHAISPGEYPVVIDANTIGLDRVLLDSTNHPVTVRAGDLTRHNLALTQGASLTGSVKIYRRAEQAEGLLLKGSKGAAAVIATGEKQQHITHSTPLSGVIVQLQKGTTKIERITGPDGDYQFTGLSPGRWKLRVLDYNIPLYHDIQQAQRPLEVLAGSETEVHLKVVPKERQLKIIDSGNLTISSAQ